MPTCLVKKPSRKVGGPEALRFAGDRIAFWDGLPATLALNASKILVKRFTFDKLRNI